jgi:hypothetical protein
MTQDVVTALIVLVAVGYSVWKLAPASWRLGAARQSGRLARAAGADDALAHRIETQAVSAAEAAGGCGNCGPCKGCSTAQAQAQVQDKDEQASA